MIAIGGTGCGINKTPYMSIARCHQHIQKTRNVAFVCTNGILYGTRYRSESRLVQYIIDILACLLAGFQLADIAFKEVEVEPGLLTDQFPYLIEILPVARRKIVQPNHFLVQPEQGLQQIRADKS